MHNDWNLQWSTQRHDDRKAEVFSVIDEYLASPPTSILDIGCGYAKESEMFQKNMDLTYILWMEMVLQKKSNQIRETNYGKVEDFGFYMNTESLKKRFR